MNRFWAASLLLSWAFAPATQAQMMVLDEDAADSRQAVRDVDEAAWHKSNAERQSIRQTVTQTRTNREQTKAIENAQKKALREVQKEAEKRAEARRRKERACAREKAANRGKPKLLSDCDGL